MKQSVRFFSFGILTASILLFGTYFFSDTSSPVEMTVEEMIKNLEDSGYRTISETDYVAFSLFKENEQAANNDNEAEKDDYPKDKDDTADNEADDDTNENDNAENEDEGNDDDADNEEDEVITHTFKTSEGVVSQSIADILIDAKIIEDRQAFLNYLDENGYSSKIQLGEFTVSSDMTFKEIAEIITTYPGS